MNTADPTFIKRVQNNDKEALSWLYDNYSPTLYGIALKIVRSETIAQDVVQEAFVKIWKNGSTYDKRKGTLFTWMLNITRNTAIDKIRSANYRGKGKIQNLDSSVYNNPGLSTENNPDHIGLKGAVGNLDEKYRVVIELVYFQGFTQQEVQETLNIPLGTVKSRVRIALRELRKIFIEHKVTILITVLLFLGS